MRQKIVNRANEILGKSRDEIGCSGTYAWCADTVSKVLEYCGITGVSSKSCNEMYRLMSKSPEWDEPNTYPVPGDPIFFDWNDPVKPDPDEDTLPLDHVGIVVDFNDATGTVTYINGNGNSSTYVTKQTISIHSRCVSYWMRYVGTDANDVSDTTEKTVSIDMPVLRNGSNSDAVKTMQVLLTNKFKYDLPKFGCDGDFGAETNSALIKFQEDNKLEKDGICGKLTWTALLK